MISANGVEYKNLPEQVQYLTEIAAEFAVELDRVTASVESVAGDVAALQTSYTTLAEDVRVAKININSLFTNVGTAFSEIANIKNGTTHLFENITDSHGNKRFVEGDITIRTIEGVTQTYGKWSLSGTHLMIVVTLAMIQGTTLLAGIPICDINLPQWILNKINPLWNTYISFIEFTTIGTGNDTKITMSLRKERLDKLTVFNSLVAYTSGRNENLRIQFDLLIDAS